MKHELITRISEPFTTRTLQITVNKLLSAEMAELSTLAFRPTERVDELSEVAGLHLVRYGGGDDFRSASSLLHLTSQPAGALPAYARIVGRLTAAASDVLSGPKPEDEMCWEHLPASAAAVDWSALRLCLAVTVSTPIAGVDAGEDLRATRASLFHHGWLHGAAAREGRSAAQAWPLIGVLAATGALSADPGDGDALGVGPSAPFDGRLAPADAHIHRVDPWAGGSRADMVALLRESGLSREDAEAFADAEAAGAGDYHFGADMARVQLRYSGRGPSFATITAPAAAGGGGGGGAGGGAGAAPTAAAAERTGAALALVACVDLSRPAAPRALLTLLAIVRDRGEQDAVRAIAEGIGGDAAVAADGIAPTQVLRLVASAAPSLAPLIEGGDGPAAQWAGCPVAL